MTTALVTPITLESLSTSTVDGSGVFDTLMRAQKQHLQEEFKAGRIKGSEYASVYLGAMQATLQSSVQFLLQRDAATLAAQKLQQEVILVQSQKALLDQQVLNAIAENDVQVAQKCLLQAQFDNTQATTLRVNAEVSLVNQKLLTEKAQTTTLGVDADSVIGRQKALYFAQTNGYSRDAEQKAADLMIKSWATRRTTDEGTVADATNMLYDAAVGRAVNKLLNGVGA